MQGRLCIEGEKQTRPALHKSFFQYVIEFLYYTYTYTTIFYLQVPTTYPQNKNKHGECLLKEIMKITIWEPIDRVIQMRSMYNSMYSITLIC